MSQYQIFVRSNCCRRLEEVNKAIDEQDPNWEGLTNAEQIISIQWVPMEQLYYITWRVRKWIGGGDGT